MHRQPETATLSEFSEFTRGWRMKEGVDRAQEQAQGDVRI